MVEYIWMIFLRQRDLMPPATPRAMPSFFDNQTHGLFFMSLVPTGCPYVHSSYSHPVKKEPTGAKDTRILMQDQLKRKEKDQRNKGGKSERNG